eukprot:4237712-Amphidinium_carterae.1
MAVWHPRALTWHFVYPDDDLYCFSAQFTSLMCLQLMWYSMRDANAAHTSTSWFNKIRSGTGGIGEFLLAPLSLHVQCSTCKGPRRTGKHGTQTGSHAAAVHRASPTSACSAYLTTPVSCGYWLRWKLDMRPVLFSFIHTCQQILHITCLFKPWFLLQHVHWQTLHLLLKAGSMHTWHCSSVPCLELWQKRT